jgi:hypothetical protein
LIIISISHFVIVELSLEWEKPKGYTRGSIRILEIQLRSTKGTGSLTCLFVEL